MTEQELAQQSQAVRDDHAFFVLREIIMLGKADKPYKQLLPELEIALKHSEAARDMVRAIDQAHENGKTWIDRSFEP